MGGGRWESGKRSEVQARSTLTSTAPKARSRSREVATLDEVPRISLRVSSKLPSLTLRCCRWSSQRSHGHWHKDLCTLSVYFDTFLTTAKDSLPLLCLLQCLMARENPFDAVMHHGSQCPRCVATDTGACSVGN